jgi:hypothetical protein
MGPLNNFPCEFIVALPVINGNCLPGNREGRNSHMTPKQILQKKKLDLSIWPTVIRHTGSGGVSARGAIGQFSHDAQIEGGTI